MGDDDGPYDELVSEYTERCLMEDKCKFLEFGPGDPSSFEVLVVFRMFFYRVMFACFRSHDRMFSHVVSLVLSN